MDYLGSQVGQKMRSAVKAKLIELGTGGATGYIDDELPDYVMIMVANKRSKQQMISDLSLFLDAHTELFVTWLHEVLQKLQEVTLPTTVVEKMKRKSTDTEAASIINKREKKDKKKEKKTKKSGDKVAELVPPTISNVFVNQLLQRATKSAPAKTVTKQESHTIKSNTDEFDIPTISEISEQTAEQTREKDLNELTELQKKIIQAKRQLKNLETDESEDEDFLSIKEDVEELDEIVGDKSVRKAKDKTTGAGESQKNNEESKENRNNSPEAGKYRKHVPIVYDKEVENSNCDNGLRKKKSVHDRLGYKSIQRMEAMTNLAKNRRLEKDYGQVVQRKEDDRKVRSKGQSSADDKECTDDGHLSKSEKPTIRRRIGSRVIVAPPKPEYKDDDDTLDKCINSLVKIKPRPPISPSKQASKNLLMRAVAEAQKSTAFIKPSKEYTIPTPQNASSSRVQKLYTKSYRDKNRKAILKRTAKDNIVVEVSAHKKSPNESPNFQEDEYVPEPISDRGDSDNDHVYVPQIINSPEHTFDSNRKEEEENKVNKTQFVVTLYDKTREKYPSKHKTRTVEKGLEGIEIKTLPASDSEVRKTPKKHTIDTKSKEPVAKKDDKEVDGTSRKSTKNKSEVENIKSSSPKLSVPVKRKRTAVSPIKFNVSGNKDSKKKLKVEEQTKRKGEPEKEDNTGHHVHKEVKSSEKIVTKASEVVSKYDNIPELNAVSVDPAVIKNKSKERCKYYPSCGKGDSCDFHHPTLPCKTFPACKFADKCFYVHPKCKFDLTCNRIGCNFSHSVSVVSNVAPPLSSHVVPVQNYKSITANPLPPMCKYYPKCTNTMCSFFHPKLCRFGKNCMNKVECNFYHHDTPNKAKFKWVASPV